MEEVVNESIVEMVLLLGSAVGATLLTAAGFVMEHAGLQDALAGQFGLGAWEIAVGGLLLFVGAYLLGYQEVRERLREFRAG